MKAISTFADFAVTPEFYIKSLALYADPDLENSFDLKDNIVSDWTPGKDIYLYVEINGTPDSDSSIIINWYCPNTHIRGAMTSSDFDYDHDMTTLTGMIDGESIRKGINLNFQLINNDGFVVSAFHSNRIILEGKRSYFPISLRNFGSHEHAFCCIEMSIDTHPDELFSQTVCKAVINKKSGIYLEKENKTANYLDTDRFIMYETWRQKLEIALNNENFEKFITPEADDDMRIGVIWTNLLTKIFPGYSLTQIRSLRNEDYATFCSAIQSHFFINYQASV